MKPEKHRETTRENHESRRGARERILDLVDLIRREQRGERFAEIGVERFGRPKTGVVRVADAPRLRREVRQLAFAQALNKSGWIEGGASDTLAMSVEIVGLGASSSSRRKSRPSPSAARR